MGNIAAPRYPLTSLTPLNVNARIIWIKKKVKKGVKGAIHDIHVKGVKSVKKVKKVKSVKKVKLLFLYSHREGKMTKKTKFIVGKFTVEMTLNTENKSLNCVWEPDVPKKLTKKMFAHYQKCRNQFMADVALEPG